jgi:hypothetical protein
MSREERHRITAWVASNGYCGIVAVDISGTLIVCAGNTSECCKDARCLRITS